MEKEELVERPMKQVDGVIVPYDDDEYEDYLKLVAADQAAKQEAAKTEWVRARLEEYPSVGELIVAFIEKYEEGRPEAMAEVQAKREAVKQQYPKGWVRPAEKDEK